MEYLKQNKNYWNEKVEHHVKSDFYDVENFKKETSSFIIIIISKKMIIIASTAIS